MLTGQWRHSLGVHPLLRKILDPPLHGVATNEGIGWATDHALNADDDELR